MLENIDDINQEDIFKSLFGIMFGAWAAGNATAFGPDTGKAKVAADRIFQIIDYPSQINAMDPEMKTKI